MKWTWTQRASAVVLLVLIVVNAHVTMPGLVASKALSLALLISGAVHASASLFVVLTDYRPFAERARAVAGVSVSLGILAIAHGSAVILRDAGPPPILGHLPGSDCAQCHTKDEHERWPVSLHRAHPESPAIDCEGCHSVGVTSPKLLATRLPGTKNGHVAAESDVLLCLECHGPHWAAGPVWPGAIHQNFKCGTCHSRVEIGGEPSWKRACHKCHPQPSDVHADVQKLDTTFTSPTSKHDVHSMKCSDCHDEMK